MCIKQCTPQRIYAYQTNQPIKVSTKYAVYFQPSVLVVAESYKFHQAKQEAGESVAVFANRLKRLAVNCKFDHFLQRALRDQFVCGVTVEMGTLLKSYYHKIRHLRNA